MVTKKAPKLEAIRPKMPKRAKEEPMAKTKRSVIVHETKKKTEDLYQVLGEVERTIQELSRIYTELPESKHRGVGGQMKPTEKQKMIQKQIDQAQARAERLIRLIEKEAR